MCQFLLYSKVTQLYVDIHSFFMFFSIIIYPRSLALVACALHFVSVSLSLFFFFFFLLFRDACAAAYGSSQARGRIGTAADGLCHSDSNAKSELCLRPLHQSSRQCWILNLLIEARDQTLICMATSWVH